MITVTDKWKEYAKNSRVFHIRGSLGDLPINGSDFMSASFQDSVSSEGDFNLGSVVTNVFKGTLINFTEKFDFMELEGQTLTLELGVEFEDGTYEYHQKGVYRIERPLALSKTIEITAYDNMDKFNLYLKNYNFEGKACYTAVSDMCHMVGVPLAGRFPNDTVVLPKVELENTATFKQYLCYIAQLCGCVARINRWGMLELKSLEVPSVDDTNALAGIVIVNQGVVGRNLFLNDAQTLLGYESLRVNSSDLTISGITVKAKDVNEDISYTSGTTGNVMTLSENPFITTLAQCRTVADRLAGMYGGMTFRPFECTCLGDPTIEAGDPVAIYLNNKVYTSIITNYEYSVGERAAVSCGWTDDVQMAADMDIFTKFAVDQAYKVLELNGLIADWIRGGDLVIGGDGYAKDGSIKVYDIENNLIAQIDRNGTVINSGSINIEAQSENESKIRLTRNLVSPVDGSRLDYELSESPSGITIHAEQHGLGMGSDLADYLTLKSDHAEFLDMLDSSSIRRKYGKDGLDFYTRQFVSGDVVDTHYARITPEGKAKFKSVNGSARKRLSTSDRMAHIKFPNNNYTAVLVTICGSGNTNGKAIYMVFSCGANKPIIHPIKEASIITYSALPETGTDETGGSVIFTTSGSGTLEFSVQPMSSEYTDITLE